MWFLCTKRYSHSSRNTCICILRNNPNNYPTNSLTNNLFQWSWKRRNYSAVCSIPSSPCSILRSWTKSQSRRMNRMPMQMSWYSNAPTASVLWKMVTATPTNAIVMQRYSSSSNNSNNANQNNNDSDMGMKLVHDYANQPQTSASLQTLLRTGRGEFLHKTFQKQDAYEGTATERVLIQVAGFLRRELPVRLAHRIKDLDHTPLMNQMSSVQQVKNLYLKSFEDLVAMKAKIQDQKDETDFAKLIEDIYERHSSVLVTMARGAFELRKAIRDGKLTSRDGSSIDYDTMEDLHEFLDKFYVSRIGIRVLIGQYLALRQPPVENYIGMINLKTSPYHVVQQAIDDATFMCTRRYGDSPPVIISGRLDLTFPYVPTHLHYIMLELLKNSMRATVDWHGVDADYPPIKVVIADGKENEDVVIKVSDEGGGIPRSNMKRIWSYLFTTADPAIQEGMVAFNEQVDHSIDSPLAGLGYGLPISRSYARYFGGDLSLISMEGYGTDAFIHLTRLGNTREPLPV